MKDEMVKEQKESNRSSAELKIKKTQVFFRLNSFFIYTAFIKLLIKFFFIKSVSFMFND